MSTVVKFSQRWGDLMKICLCAILICAMLSACGADEKMQTEQVFALETAMAVSAESTQAKELFDYSRIFK